MDQASSFIPQPPTETSGPEFYNYRRALWLNAIPSPDFDPSIVRPRVYPQPPSSSITRLQSILTGDNVEEDEHLWENYLSKVFDSLVGGQRLRRGLGLSWVVSFHFSVARFSHVFNLIYGLDQDPTSRVVTRWDLARLAILRRYDKHK
jgi:hypothetical protein